MKSNWFDITDWHVLIYEMLQRFRWMNWIFGHQFWPPRQLVGGSRGSGLFIRKSIHPASHPSIHSLVGFSLSLFFLCVPFSLFFFFVEICSLLCWRSGPGVLEFHADKLRRPFIVQRSQAAALSPPCFLSAWKRKKNCLFQFWNWKIRHWAYLHGFSVSCSRTAFLNEKLNFTVFFVA